MDSSVPQEVLRCELCSKPFDRKASLKRHLYYCRDKKNLGRRVRVRSCLTCTRAKTRCDTTRPSCSRCARRHILCSYPIVEPRASHDDNLYLDHWDVRETLGLSNASSGSLSLISVTEPLEVDLGLSEFSFAFPGYGLPDWGLPKRKDIDPYDGMDQTLPMLSQPADHNAWQSSTHMTEALNGQFSILQTPTNQFRSFAQSNPTTRPNSVTTTLMKNILTSYPKVMYNPGSLPPFIHPHSVSHSLHNPQQGFEALTTCVSLMQMVSSGAPGSQKLFWKNVRLECERLQVETSTLDKWDLLSAMQALTVYILARLLEGESPDNNYDFLLLSTLWIVACALNEKVNFGLCTARSGLYSGPGRHEWIFEESRRRLSLVYQILKMLYSLDPATSCTEPDGFLIAPLPGRKQLWEAGDSHTWTVEKSRDKGNPSVFAVLTGGQMVKLQEQQLVVPNEINGMMGIGEEESAKNWQEWCAGMDGLGALVTLATCLVSA